MSDSTDLAVIEYPGANPGDGPDMDAEPEHVEGEPVDPDDEGEFVDSAAFEQITPYEFRARLKGAVPIKRDKDGRVSLEVTFIVWSTAIDAHDTAGPILSLIGENDPSMVFDVLVTPTLKQGRLV